MILSEREERGVRAQVNTVAPRSALEKLAPAAIEFQRRSTLNHSGKESPSCNTTRKTDQHLPSHSKLDLAAKAEGCAESCFTLAYLLEINLGIELQLQLHDQPAPRPLAPTQMPSNKLPCVYG